MHALKRIEVGVLAIGLACMWLSPAGAQASPFSVPLLSAPAGESADSDSVAPEVLEAQAAYRSGSDAYALGKYEKAVTHFEHAYELSHEPALLFNLGQAYARWYDLSNDLDHLERARRLYENYVLNVDGTQLDEAGRAEARADAQHRIKEVDRRIALHTQDQDPDPGEADEKKLHQKAWFWIVIIGGAAVVAGVTTAVVLTTRDKPAFEPELGTIGASSYSGARPGGFTIHF